MTTEDDRLEPTMDDPPSESEADERADDIEVDTTGRATVDDLADSDDGDDGVAVDVTDGA